MVMSQVYYVAAARCHRRLQRGVIPCRLPGASNSACLLLFWTCEWAKSKKRTPRLTVQRVCLMHPPGQLQCCFGTTPNAYQKRRSEMDACCIEHAQTGSGDNHRCSSRQLGGHRLFAVVDRKGCYSYGLCYWHCCSHCHF